MYETFGKAKEDWFRTCFLELPNARFASHDTFGRFFSMLDPQGFKRCLPQWVQDGQRGDQRASGCCH